jgi:ArsR family transcriptional regulator, arsenate/arsenite/antimonite-responsive transcriptional repressor
LSTETEHVLQQFKQCIPLLDVLTDENRQKIIMLLAVNKEGLNVNTITENISLSRPAISHHLKVLTHSGFINYKKTGTENYYFLTVKNPIEKLKQLILAIENQCNS